ncbi:MAG: HEAT repeat domain-containing protein, partial [Microcoleus sp.]
MKPEVARRRIEAFERRFGKTHLIFACHAAFPLALTPDLLYKLWANFQRDIHGLVLGIPWVAVADLLLSSLCEEVGRELYEMDTAVRNSLLNRLKDDENFGQQRINELSDFLLVYVQQQLQSNDLEVRDFAQAQRWTALAYVRPTEAAQELRAMLEQAYKQDKSEQLRLVSLVEAFAEPLVEFEPLLVLVNEIRKGKSEDDNKPNKQESKNITKIPSGYYAFKPKPIVEKLALLTFVGDVDNGFNVLLEI